MGFLSKIFGRGKSGSGSKTSPTNRNNDAVGPAGPSSIPQKKGGRGSSGRLGKRNGLKASATAHTLRGESPTEQLEATNGGHDPVLVPISPSRHNVASSGGLATPSPTSSKATASSGRRGPDGGAGATKVNAASSPRAAALVAASKPSSPRSPRRGVGPVDMDQSDLESEADEQMHRRNAPRLNLEELNKLDSRTTLPAPKYTMADSSSLKLHQPLAGFSAGQVALNVDNDSEHSQSDAESSSFNLSTDADDSEYEAVRRGVPYGHHANPLHAHQYTSAHHQRSMNNRSLDTSNLSVASPSVYTTDGETSVFPNLPTDDEASTVTGTHGRPYDDSNLGGDRRNMLGTMPPYEPQLKSTAAATTTSPAPAASTPSSTTTTAASTAATTMSTTTNTASPPSATGAALSRIAALAKPEKDTAAVSTSPKSKKKQQLPQSANNNNSGGPTAWSDSNNWNTAATATTSPTKSIASSTTGGGGGGVDTAWNQQPNFGKAATSSSPKKRSNDPFNFANFDNFADFTTADFGGANGSNKVPFEEEKTSKSTVDHGNPRSPSAVERSRRKVQISADAASLSSRAEQSLAKILKEAKEKSSSRRHHQGSGSHRAYSVNSAPVITNQSIQDTLRRARVGRYSGAHSATFEGDSSGGAGGGGANTTKVTDIIKSLEDAQNARHHHSSTASYAGSRASSSQHRRAESTDGLSAAQSRDSSRRLREKRRSRRSSRTSDNDAGGSGGGANGHDSSDSEDNDGWLFDELQGALGPRGIAPDLESLSGRSQASGGARSHKSHRSHRSHKSHRSSTARRPGHSATGSSGHHHHNHGRQPHGSSTTRHKSSSGESVDSHGSKKSHGSRRSRSSRYSHKSTRSYISQMSEQSRSVANDLLRLEMQLAMVGSSSNNNNSEDGRVNNGGGTTPSSSSALVPSSNSSRGGAAGSVGGGGSRSATLASSGRASSSAGSASAGRRHGVSSARRSRVTITAPPGKLGIILANKADSRGTVVSGVRNSSVLATKINAGDRIVAIDGEDVSLMTVSEITTIMARKSEFDRTLTVLTTPRHVTGAAGGASESAAASYLRYGK